MKYIVFKERVTDEELGKYISYGVKMKEKGIVIRIISDVGISRKRVCRLCRLCNRLKVPADQIDYILEDFCVSEAY